MLLNYLTSRAVMQVIDSFDTHCTKTSSLVSIILSFVSWNGPTLIFLSIYLSTLLSLDSLLQSRGQHWIISLLLAALTLMLLFGFFTYLNKVVWIVVELRMRAAAFLIRELTTNFGFLETKSRRGGVKHIFRFPSAPKNRSVTNCQKPRQKNSKGKPEMCLASHSSSFG